MLHRDVGTGYEAEERQNLLREPFSSSTDPNELYFKRGSSDFAHYWLKKLDEYTQQLAIDPEIRSYLKLIIGGSHKVVDNLKTIHVERINHETQQTLIVGMTESRSQKLSTFLERLNNPFAGSVNADVTTRLPSNSFAMSLDTGIIFEVEGQNYELRSVSNSVASSTERASSLSDAQLHSSTLPETPTGQSSELLTSFASPDGNVIFEFRKVSNSLEPTSLESLAAAALASQGGAQDVASEEVVETEIETEAIQNLPQSSGSQVMIPSVSESTNVDFENISRSVDTWLDQLWSVPKILLISYGLRKGLPYFVQRFSKDSWLAKRFPRIYSWITRMSEGINKQKHLDSLILITSLYAFVCLFFLTGDISQLIGIVKSAYELSKRDDTNA